MSRLKCWLIFHLLMYFDGFYYNMNPFQMAPLIRVDILFASMIKLVLNQCSRCNKQAAFLEFNLQLYNISTKYSEKNVLFKLSDVVKY